MQNSKLPRSLSSYYMYGTHAVFAAINNPKRKIVQILCTKEIFHEHQNIISKSSYEIIDNKSLNKILGIGHNHQGIVAKTSSIFCNNFDDIDLTASNMKIAILDQITDSHNIGAIIRSAAAFDISAILLPYDHSPNENTLIAKAACGALEMIPIIKIVNLSNTIEYLKTNGFWIGGLDVTAKQLISECKALLSGKVAIILGSEDRGLRKLTKEKCDFLIKIPITEKVESLNVANSAAIAFYSLFKNLS